MEELLHYVWKHKLFTLKPLQTTDGQPIEIIDPGLANMHAGPDFFNAKIKINDVTWVGNIEIHQQASDWFRHNRCCSHTKQRRDYSTDGVTLPTLSIGKL